VLHQGPVEGIFYPSNGVAGGTQDVEYLRGLQELRDIVARAVVDGKRLRAYGSKWSASSLAYEEEYQIQPWDLNYCKVGFQDALELIDPSYHATANQLVFVQAGVMITDLHDVVEARDLALPTTGAAGGQRFVGAAATGTHGSRNNYTAVQDYVKAIHLVLPDGEVVIQAQSDPVVTDAFAKNYLDGAVLTTDDATFRAAQIHLGSFGIVHGLLIETEPLYYLRRQQKWMPLNQVKQAFYSLDAASLGFEGFTETPFDFSVYFNPFVSANDPKSAMVTVYRKFMPDELLGGRDDTTQPEEEGGSFLSDILAILLAPFDFILRILASFIYSIATTLLMDGYYDEEENGVMLRPSQLFYRPGSEDPTSYMPINTVIAEVAFSIDDLEEALEIITAAVQLDPIPAEYLIRWMKPSPATMAFTRFSPMTVTVDISTVLDFFLFFVPTDRSIRSIWRALDEAGIDYTYHWAKYHPEDYPWVEQKYDAASVAAWKQQRALLLGPEGCAMFSSAWLDSVGLNDTCETAP